MGKRFLVLSSILVSSASYLVIGVIGLAGTSNALACWTKLVLFFLAQFSSSLGIMPIGWIIVSEVFPMKYVYLCLKLQKNSGTTKNLKIDRVNFKNIYSLYFLFFYSSSVCPYRNSSRLFPPPTPLVPVLSNNFLRTVIPPSSCTLYN